ncbi:MAG: serine dehydratase subunit alpha family protein, partial [Clostridia bacterium]|nr:serine dehydratase subunit alpha family protein [Clostridia bacterium]
VNEKYLEILKSELVPAMGCTEPISVAYAAALARKVLGVLPTYVRLTVSANIIKNVKSVVVPNTGGLRGISAAAAAGIVAGNADAVLEVLCAVSEEEKTQIADYMEKTPIEIRPSDGSCVFEVEVLVGTAEDSALVHLAGDHTNIVCIAKNGVTLQQKHYTSEGEIEKPYRDLLSIERIVEYANEAVLTDIEPILSRQITYNTAIAREGLRGTWGASIGKILLDAYGDSVSNRAKAWAAAGSDARMSGCELPVIINSGSGNQGMTASLPVIVYAEELHAPRELLLRALIVSNLVTIHMKTGVGCLSAYCGATSAGCGAAAGITYLYGGDANAISHTIVNAVAINSGMICDGAKPSCAAKIASAVEAGLLGMQMQRYGTEFYAGEGIVVKGVENTIKNIGELARIGMKATDAEIIRMMTRDSRTPKRSE